MAVSLEKLEDFLADNIGKIEAIEKEVEEIQVGFNSAYQDFKDQHDATLRRSRRGGKETCTLHHPSSKPGFELATEGSKGVGFG